jgi:hypothetical protein
MSTKNCRTDESIAQIRDLVNELLADEVPAADVSFCLASLAIDLGLQAAPTSEQAIGVVLSAMTAVIQAHGSYGEDLNSDSDSSEVEQSDIPNALPSQRLLH